MRCGAVPNSDVMHVVCAMYLLCACRCAGVGRCVVAWCSSLTGVHVLHTGKSTNHVLLAIDGLTDANVHTTETGQSKQSVHGSQSAAKNVHDGAVTTSSVCFLNLRHFFSGGGGWM